MDPFRRLAKTYKQAFSEKPHSHIWIQVLYSILQRRASDNALFTFVCMQLVVTSFAGRRPGHPLLVETGSSPLSRLAMGITANHRLNWVSFVSVSHQSHALKV